MHVIPKTMRAVVYRGANDLRLETVPVPRIGSNELLVKVAACGVCPTDIKKIHHGTVPAPRVFGHETAGTIVRRGARVKGFDVGDRVALHHHIPCLDCHACRHRAFAQCAGYKRTGITAGFEPAGGGYAEYVRVLSFCLPGVVKIPARNTFAEGAMLEPVNTVFKAIERLALLRGDSVLVAGQGPIGLMFTRLLALRDDAKATAFLKANGLEEGEFLCCIPRLRFTPYWTIPDKKAAFDEKKHARNEALKEQDHAPHRQAIIEVLRQTKLKVLICPEDQTQMAVGKELLYDPLPADVKPRAVWRPNYWLTGEAISVYTRSAGLFGNGIPAIVCRWAEQTSKGLMWRYIGLGDWLFDFDKEEERAKLVPAVLAMAKDPAAAKAKAAKAREFVMNKFAASMAVVKKNLAA